MSKLHKSSTLHKNYTRTYSNTNLPSVVKKRKGCVCILKKTKPDKRNSERILEKKEKLVMTERQRKALSTHILKPWTFLDITHRRCTLECKWISWIRHKRVFTLSAPQYKVHMITGWTMWELPRVFNSLEILSCALPPACFAQVPPLMKTRQNVCSNENASYMKRYMRYWLTAN